MASKSSSSTSSQTQANTTNTYNTSDQRQGVEGSGNLTAAAGASVTVNDNSEVIAQAALDAANSTSSAALKAQMDTARASLSAQSDTAQAALTSNAQVSQAAAHVASDALSAMVDSQAKSLDSVNHAVDASTGLAGKALDNSQRTVDTVSKTFSDLSAGQVNLLAQLIRSNADTTQAVQKENADLANSYLEKTVTAIADNKTSPDQTIVTTGIKYAGYAAIAVAIAFGIYAVSRSKK
jgi:hypothetical protein